MTKTVNFEIMNKQKYAFLKEKNVQFIKYLALTLIKLRLLTNRNFKKEWKILLTNRTFKF